MLKYENENSDILEYLLEKLVNKYGENKVGWRKGTELIFDFKFGKEQEFFEIKDSILEISGDTLETYFKKLQKVMEEYDKEKLTAEKVKKSPLKHLFENPTKYNGLINNHIVFKKLEKELNSLGIKEVVMEQKYSNSASIRKVLTLAIETFPTEGKPCPAGFFDMIKNALSIKFIPENKREEFDGTFATPSFLIFEKENTRQIKLGETIIGIYYPERNFIHLYINPFKFQKILPLKEDMNNIFRELFISLKSAKLKYFNTEPIRGKIFITAFLSKSRERVDEITARLKLTEENISESEKKLRREIGIIQELREENDFIKKNIDNNGKGLFTEIKLTEKLPFIEKVDINTETFILHFTDSILRINEFKNNGKSFGRRSFYLGKPKIEIGPGTFVVKNIVTLNGHPLPHVSSSGNPCFGEGDGRNKIYELLAQNKISDVAKMLWFWIKTHREAGAYVHINELYDLVLAQGYPVWDENGKRIALNDEKRLQTKEQHKLREEGNYNENIKKYEDIKLI